jgi:hypothetical protein
LHEAAFAPARFSGDDPPLGVGDQPAPVPAGRDDGRGTWRSLNALNQLGVTRGTLQMV